MRRAIAALVCALALPCAGAPLTNAEKELLARGISQKAAEDYGRAGDAAGLERIVALGDPALVSWFGRGMQLAQMQMPPEVEAIVVARFNDPRMGEALRAMPVKYRSRALFDLHYARVAKAYQLGEPSIGQILNTEQAGIEEDLLKLGSKLPKGRNGIDGFTSYLARHRYPGALPILFAALEASFADPRETGWNEVLEGLLAYPSLEIWQRTSLEIERLRAADRLTPAQHQAARAKLDPLLKDPAAKLEWMRVRDAGEAYQRRVSALSVNTGRIDSLKATDPAAYVREQSRYLLRKEEIAREIDAARLLLNVGHERLYLAMFARFRARDAAGAAKLFAEAAAVGNDLAQVALADTYQFDLKNRPAAVEAYRTALAEARNPTRRDRWSLYEAPGTPVNAWWQAWLAGEIAYLRDGLAFRGMIGEAEVAGFFEVMLNKSVHVTGVFAPEFRIPNSRGATDARGRPVGGTWSAARGNLRESRNATLAARLDALPPSRLALMMAIRHASALPDADAIIDYFANNDPSGYWSACVFGTVFRLDHMGNGWQDEAVRNESAELLPGMTAEETPRALSVAAQRFMESHGLRAVPVR